MTTALATPATSNVLPAFSTQEIPLVRILRIDAPEDRFGFHTQEFGHHSGGSTMIAGGSASFRC
jgi:hypothetical protein